ncbi:putative pentatricopeptide repeat-containing protein At3g05240 [Silene latifolia]|uniref:putative pentatricopeptide repeat-containing protein At3g05240 n=1 Tax=Silene latifolia TaxID=37657 RepID=UPI003D76B685
MNVIFAFRIQKDAIKFCKIHNIPQSFFFSTSSDFEVSARQRVLSSNECGAIFQSLTNSKSLKMGQSLHGYVIRSGLIQDNTYLCTKIAAFYAGCGCMNCARIIFDKIVNKSCFLWNFMIRGYASNGFSMQAISLYRTMMRIGVLSDNFTYPFVIKACGDLVHVYLGRIVHAQAVINGFHFDIYVGNCLLAMYARFRDMENARKVFDVMPKRDLTSSNTMISGYARNGNPSEALRIFQKMLVTGAGLDSTTLLSVLSACSELNSFGIGKQVHGYLLRNHIHCLNNFLPNSLMEVYCTSGSMIYAMRLFEVSRKDSVSWNTLISGYARNDEDFEGLSLFCQMVTAGKQPDLATFIVVLGICEKVAALNFGMSVQSYLVREGFGRSTMAATALIGMYSRCGELTYSRLVFEEIEEKNLVCWTAMISAYGNHGKGKEAISILHQMIANDIVPDEGTFTSILTACSHAGLVEEGGEIFHKIHQKCNIKPVLAHYACFVDLLSRAGQLDEAYAIICSMEVKPTTDIWASFLSGCRLHGNVTLAEVAGREILEAKSAKVGGYICLSHVYADEKRWNDVERVRVIVQSKAMAKPTAYSYIK